MKKYIIVGLSFVSMIACKKSSDPVAITETTAGKATLQVYNAALGTSRNYIYLDNKPIVGSAIGYATLIPSNFRFSVIPGSRQVLIKDTLATSMQAQLNFTQNFDADADYTIFMYDTSIFIKQKTVKNNIVIPTDTTCRLRFANLVYSPTALPNMDVYSFRRGNTTPLFSNIATGQVTDFIPVASALTDTFYILAAGTTSPIISKIPIPALAQKRGYTSAYLGSLFAGRSISTSLTY